MRSGEVCQDGWRASWRVGSGGGRRFGDLDDAAVTSWVVGHTVEPAAVDDPDPGAGQHADGVRVVMAAGYRVQAPGGADEDTDGGFSHGGWQMPYGDELFGKIIMQGIASAGAAPPNVIERATWTAVARVLMNLDETITKN